MPKADLTANELAGRDVFSLVLTVLLGIGVSVLALVPVEKLLERHD
jgi:hypothetical protein